MTRRALATALPAATLAALLSLPFFVRPLVPWPDQGQVLHAGLRHARGLGLTVPVSDRRDITLMHAERLTYFPPLYALVVSACLRASGVAGAPADGPDLVAGRALERIVKLTNAVALVAGVLGWCLLGAQVLHARVLRFLFAGLLVVAGGATVPLGGTADYLLWAALPWWAGALLLADRAADDGRRRRACLLALAGGLTGAVLTGVRWATVFLVPAAGLFWLERALLDNPHREPDPARPRALAPRLAPTVAAILPIVATYAAITAANYRLGGSASVLSYVEPHWSWRHLATLFPFESLFAVPLGLEPLLTRVWRALEPQRASLALGLVFRVVLPAAALIALVRRARRARAENARPDTRRAQALAVATALALLPFLAFMSLRYTWSFADWAYLDEPRYYRPVWPLAALFWLALLDRLPPASRFRTAASALLLVGALYLLQAQGRAVLAQLAAQDERQELVAHVRALGRRPGLHVVLDNDVSEYVLSAGARLVARGYPEPDTAPTLVAGRRAEAWLVRRLREPTPYVRDRDWDRKRFDAVRARFGGTRVWVSSRGAYEVWHAPVGPEG